MTEEEREAERNFALYDLGDVSIDDILPPATGKASMSTTAIGDWHPGCGCGNCSPWYAKDPEPETDNYETELVRCPYCHQDGVRRQHIRQCTAYQPHHA